MTKKKDVSELSYLSKLPENCALSDAVRFFGTKTALAKALGLGKVNPKNGQMEGDRQVVSEWFRRGAIPRKYVVPIHEKTGIALAELLQDFTPYTPQTEKKKAKAAKEEQAPAVTPEPVVDDVLAVLKKKPAARRKKAVA